MIINTNLPPKFSTHLTNSKSLFSATKLYRSLMAPPQVDDEYRQQIKSAREQLDELISKDKRYYAPLMLHLALHDAGIYGFITDTEYCWSKRGPNGSIGTEVELNHPLNTSLKKAVERCAKDEVKRHNKKITYADLYQLAGVAAVQNTGGPPIEFVPGREDSTKNPEIDLLQSKKLDESTLEKIRKRMGLEEKDIVALFGGLHQWKFPPEETKAGNQPNQPAEFKFDNSYFKSLKKEDPNNLFLKSERFRKWVDTYEKTEKDNDFFKDYAAAHKKVSELGMSVVASPGQGGRKQTDQKTSAPSASSWNRARLVQGLGIAVVTTAIIVGFFFSRRSKSS